MSRAGKAASGGGGGGGVQGVADAAARLALIPADGMIVLQKDVDDLYAYDITTVAWIRLTNNAVLHSPVTIGTANGLSLVGQALSLGLASAGVTGALSGTDWSTFNNKVATTRSIATTAPLAGGGDLSANRTLSITQATTGTDGYLSQTDWNTFNNKVPAARIISTSSPLTGGANLSGDISLGINVASGSSSGYLSQTDWNTFNGKQSALSFGNFTASDASLVLTGSGTNRLVGGSFSVAIQYSGAAADSGYIKAASTTKAGGLHVQILQSDLDALYRNIVSTVSLTNGSTITVAANARSLVKVSGNGGAATASATTGLTAGTFDGQEVILVGTSDTNPVIIEPQGNVRVNGTLVLANRDSATLFWNSTVSQWWEISRS